MDLREIKSGLDEFGSCEQGNDTSGSITGEEFLD
jgi:hypothetical protein